MNISTLISKIVNNSTEVAIRTGYDHIQIDHTVVTILRSPAISEILSKSDIASGDIADAIEKVLVDQSPYTQRAIEQRVRDNYELSPSTHLMLVISDIHAIALNEQIGIEQISANFVLRVIIEKEYPCSFNALLQKNPAVRKRILSILTKKASSEEASDAVESALVNLNKLAEENKIDPIIGRDKDIQEMSEMLAKKKKNNIMLLGKAGTGKTAMAEGLALSIVNGTAPKELLDKTVYSLDVSALLAGTKFRGEFEQRAQEAFNMLTSDENSILFIDEIHTVMGAGASSQGGMDLSNMMKPHLARGTLRCIGATTIDEYKAVIEKDPALVRRFSKYTINEPNKAVMLEILAGMRQTYSEFHGVEYSDESLEAIYELSTKYIQNRANPDKAVDVMDGVGAYVKTNDRNKVELADIQLIVSRASSVPVASMVIEKENNCLDLAGAIKKSLFGQDHVVDKLCEQIIMAKAGLVEPNKPVASFLLVGTTGTGKTELARQVASNLKLPLVKFDMSEFQEEHSVAKLIGAPPGYAGYDENSARLIDEVEQNPSCVLLMDEVEKAHPKVMDVFLQIMDDAKLTSSHGKTVLFNNVILLMTSNAGARESNNSPMGFSGSVQESKVSEAVNKFFRPEFVNRLDGIVKFNNLNKADVIRIVEKEIRLINDMVSPKGIVLNISATAKQFLADAGYNPKMGAREIKRAVAEHVKKPLSTKIVKGDFKEGDTVKINVKDGAITFLKSSK